MATSEALQLLSLSLGYVIGQALRAAALLRLPEAMAAGATSTEAIAVATGTDPASLARLLRTLASAGVVASAQDRWRLTAMGQALRGEAPGSVRDAVVWVGEPMHYASCAELASSVRTGRPAFDALFGTGYFEHLARAADAARSWDAGMANFSSLEDAVIAQTCVLEAATRVVDVGGGQGGFLAQLLLRNAALRGVLFDRLAVVAHPRRLVDAGLQGRFETAAGDFFDAVPQGGDVYVYKRVLHDWDDESCIALLRRCREMIPPAGRLLVIDAVIPAGDDPHPAKIIDLVMMGILPGRERTAQEFEQIFHRAGFELTAVLPTPSMLALVEGRPRRPLA